MTQKTKTEYETVEKTFIECDVDGCSRTDEEWEMIDLAVNPEYLREGYKEPQVIEVVDHKGKADEWVKDKKEKMVRDFSNMHKPAYGYMHRKRWSNPQCSEKFDICIGCLSEIFGISVDPEDVCEIEADRGGMTIIEETSESVLNEKIKFWLFGMLTVVFLLLILDFITLIL